MPILHHLVQNKDVIYFLDDSYTLEDHNTYTFLTGKNAIGKSRLLRSIIIHCIKNSIFDRTVALSNTQYHKFPNYSDIQNINKNYINYLKLAFSDRNNSTTNEQYAYNSNLNFIYDFFIEHNIKTFDTEHTTLNLLKAFEYLIIKLSKNEKSYNSLRHVLAYLKFDEKIIFEITTSASLTDIKNIIKSYAINKIHKNSQFYDQLFLLQSCIFDIGKKESLH